MTHVLYLHGFLSSPQSQKARLTVDWFARHYPQVTLHVPQLTNQPSAVADQLADYLATHPEVLADGLKVIGSSMGGFLATHLVEQHGGRAVLINPAVRPYELLLDYLGEHVNPYTREQFVLQPQDMHSLQALDSPLLAAPQAYRVMLQTGDETLDYRQAEAKYQHASLVIEQGGDHSFVDYARHLPEIAAFLLPGEPAS